MLDLLFAMENFSGILGLSGSGLRSELKAHAGCHLCISMRGGFDGYGITESIHGYIQVSALIYYQLLNQMVSPQESKEWFSRFKALTDVKDQEPMT